MKTFLTGLESVLGLVYPNICKICHKAVSHHDGICTTCVQQIGRIEKEHPFMHQWQMRLYSRFPISWYYPLFDVALNDFSHRIVKSIKYKSAPEIAQRLGGVLGERIAEYAFEKPQAIIPVPLHPEKKRRRGYNQAEEIAKGLAESLDIAVMENAVSRTKNTRTQTKMNRWQRMSNMDKVFTCHATEKDFPEHVLLCDDVLTTGSTIEALRSVLPNKLKVAVATLGVA